jgi:hypothetical protein
MNDAPSPSRPPPPEVKPVELNGIRYEQDKYQSREKGDQPGGYLAATDLKTGKQLWRIKVYEIPRPGDPNVPDLPLEFQSMTLVPGMAVLEIVNESGYKYHVDLETKAVKLVSRPEGKGEPAPPPKPKPKPPAG